MNCRPTPNLSKTIAIKAIFELRNLQEGQAVRVGASDMTGIFVGESPKNLVIIKRYDETRIERIEIYPIQGRLDRCRQKESLVDSSDPRYLRYDFLLKQTAQMRELEMAR